MAQEINVVEIMQEIKRDIENKQLSDKIISFEDIPLPRNIQLENDDMNFNLDDLRNNLSYLNYNYYVQAYRQLHSRPIVGGLIIFVKKILRKCIKFYIEPIVTDQNEINASIVRCMNQINNYIEEQMRKTEVKDSVNEKGTESLEIQRLKKKIEILEAENAVLKQTI